MPVLFFLEKLIRCSIGVYLLEVWGDCAMGKMAAVLIAAVLLSCTLAVSVNAANTTSGFPVPAYFVLGDTFVDGGNNNFIASNVPKANFKPYGITYFKGIPTGRFSDGRIFSDLQAVPFKLSLAVPSLSSPTDLQKKTSINYASGGAGIFRTSSVAMGAGNAISFENQVIAYETYAADVIFQFGADEAMLSLSGAIYHVNFGSADILAYFTKPAYATTAGTVSKFIDGLAFEYQRMIERLYLQGARKVVVFGVGPLHKSPQVVLLASKFQSSDGRRLCASMDAAIRQLNRQLLHMVNVLNADNELGMEHASLQLVYADVYGAGLSIIKSPASHGLTDVKNACCGAGKYGAEVACGTPGHKVCRSPSKSLYWNDMQFTEMGNKRLFKLFFDGSRYITPFSIKHLAKMLIPGVPY